MTGQPLLFCELDLLINQTDREKPEYKPDEKKRGWRSISVQERIEASKYIDKLETNTKKQIRDKAVLTYFVNENMSASAISRLNDPRIVCFSNRKKGKPLSYCSIIEIIYQHFPMWRGRQCTGRSSRKRIDLIRKRQKHVSPHIKQCAFCGQTDNLEEHHMIPLFMGGTNDDRNLIFLCHKCHREVTTYQSRTFRNTDHDWREK